MAKTLNIGTNDRGHALRLPLEIAGLTIAILAKKRKGKTYLASVLAEEMLDAGIPIVAIDPTGAWSGLKSSADGKSAGYPVVVFGGRHADLPLVSETQKGGEAAAGELIATTFVEQRFSCILDVSLLRKGTARRVLTAFCETLYRLNTESMHLFIDEADDAAPQRCMGDEAFLLGAVEDLVKRGGLKGIGTTLITQRPQALNKDVLTMAELLLVLAVSHPLDIKSIDDWVGVHGDVEDAKRMKASLPAMERGTAWAWAPPLGIFEQIKVRQRRTFDSSATPKPGQTIRPPKVLAKVDRDKLGAALNAAAAEAAENKPDRLRQKIVSLEQRLAAAQKSVAAGKTVVDSAASTRSIERAVAAAVRDRDAAHKARVDALRRPLSMLLSAATNLSNAVAALKAPWEALGQSLPPLTITSPSVTTAATRTPPRAAVAPSGEIATQSDIGSGGAKRMLDVLLRHHPGKITEGHWAAIAGLKRSGGTWGTYKSRLSRAGLIAFDGEHYAATEAAVAAYGVPAAPAADPLDEWKAKLGAGPSKIIDALRANGPLRRDELAEACGLTANAGTFGTYLSRLTSCGVVTRSKDDGAFSITEELL